MELEEIMADNMKGIFVAGEEVGISKCSRIQKCNIIKKNGEPPYKIMEDCGDGMYYVETPKNGIIMIPGTCLAKM